MIFDRKLLDILELSFCFLCKKKFKENDMVGEFFGGYAHDDCFDKKMKENKERDEARQKQ